MFHAFWPPGHNSTNYPRYYSASPGEVYKVTEYQHHYEPYVVFKKDGPPWCDERFVGYGGNKAACLYEMYLSGMNFFVLADHFIVHQSHKYPETLRKNEVSLTSWTAIMKLIVSRRDCLTGRFTMTSGKRCA